MFQMNQIRSIQSLQPNVFFIAGIGYSCLSWIGSTMQDKTNVRLYENNSGVDDEKRQLDFTLVQCDMH